MKFTDGYWLWREGTTAVHPAQVYRVTPTPDSLTVLAPVKQLKTKGDLTSGPVVTVRCTSPMPDVIAVDISHFYGDPPAHPELDLDLSRAAPVDVTVDDEAAVLTSGDLSVRFTRGDTWSMDFLAGGRVLTRSGDRAMAVIDSDGQPYIREQLDLGVGQHVYGLGERFGPLVRNGQSVDIWNADGGTSTEQAYKNVPFYLTDAGYGVFVHHSGKVSYEVASEAVARVQFSVPGQTLRYYVVHGPTPKDILRRYTALTGRPARLPAWSYGLWLSTSFTTSYDEDTVTSFIDGMAERDLPLSVFHFDCFWMRGYQWCDFAWDEDAFPDPPGMLKRLKERGLRICLWINPYISQHSPLFEEGRRAGYLLRRPDGRVWQWDRWQPGLAVVDFTNPAARTWFEDKLGALLDMGVDSFKTDFGERIPLDVEYFDGSDPERMHNHYAHLYNEVVFGVLERHRGHGDAVLFARAAAAGTQRFPVHWSGDGEATFEGMAQSLRGGLSLGLSGFGYWSHDIGGFTGRPDAAVFKRWIAFGLLSSHSRLHGGSSYRVPWTIDEESVSVLRDFTRLKMRLMPYLARIADEAHTEGLPMMRPMILEFPDDPACAYLETQYMLGDSLLVAPVFNAEGHVRYYVPAGTWTSLLTGENVTGPRWVDEQHGFDSLPLLVRPGTVLPLGAVDDTPEYDYAAGVTLRLHTSPATPLTVTDIVAPDGTLSASFTVDHADGRTRVTPDRPVPGWSVLLAGAPAPATVEHATVEHTPDGALLRPVPGAPGIAFGD
ncbi:MULTISPECIES: alpha-xylosidase [unclassified Streptomyces]|uniref:alpha-xylosidase n=1 Tax=unclassified Streptomyces TaxID=2593676 RepID=UPI000DD50021|nr:MULTISPECIES: alpha-xylosidase [unclassified Streptomyces]QZZ25366.1 alpha-xylosidase [Streptomyces sp. ST1015]